MSTKNNKSNLFILLFRLYTEIEMTSDDSELDFEFKLREKEEELELGTVTLHIGTTTICSLSLVC